MSEFKKVFLLLIFGTLAVLPMAYVLGQRLGVAQLEKENLAKETPKIRLDPSKANHFVEEDGAFEFDYKNTLEVKLVEGIVTVQGLRPKEPIFQIFELKTGLEFEASAYTCETKMERQICYSKATPSQLVTNITLFPELDLSKRFTFFSRAEAIDWVLKSHSPRDYSSFADSCFADVTKNHPQSGAICYAKTQGILEGVNGNFYPDASVSLWSLLKMIFLVGAEKDAGFDERLLDTKMFELMTRYHLAYPLIAKAYYEGIFQNTTGEDIWPDRAIYKAEAEAILANFKAWNAGKTLRNYTGTDTFILEDRVRITKADHHFKFKEKSDDDDFNVKANQAVTFEQNGKGVDIYLWHAGGVEEYFTHLSTISASSIHSVDLEYDPSQPKAQIKVTLNSGKTEEWKLDLDSDEFAYLANSPNGTLDNPDLLPNKLAKGATRSFTKIKISLAHEDFEHLFKFRTVNTSYPAHMEMIYPDGRSVEKSVMIKTRGNASRATIKSSYSIDALDAFKENSDYAWDNFLDNRKGFKLRSQIMDESMIREKLAYQTFQDFGYPAPHFFDTVLEINGVLMGLYQATEPIDDDFFKSRNLDVKHYIYALNMTSLHSADVSYHVNDATTLAHYEVSGSETKLLEFIQALDARDPLLIHSIDVQNVFDYAMFVYLTNAYDSLNHNYYLYFDESTKLWKIFLWDGDTAFNETPEISDGAFGAFVQNQEGWNNNLVYYVFQNLSPQDFKTYYDSALEKWAQESQVLQDKIDFLLSNEAEFYIYDNLLWNGKRMERNKPFFDTIRAISELKAKLKKIQNSIEISSKP